jgi:hypothetical protein
MDYSEYKVILIICGYYDSGVRFCKMHGLSPRDRRVTIITPDNYHTRLRGFRGTDDSKVLVLHGAYEGRHMSDVFDQLKISGLYIGDHNADIRTI